MNTQQTFRQANAFAMYNGLLFGLYWCFGFFCMVKGIGNDTLNSLGFMITISAPILGGYFAHRFEKQVRPDGYVSYGKAYLYSALLYFYATTILAIVSFCYFKWFDHGMFVNSYITLYNSPEMQDALQQAQMTELLDNAIQQNGFESLEQLLHSITPTEIVAGLFNTNIFVGLILALPTALFAKSRKNSL